MWPRSTERKPKQFSFVGGEGTLIQNTVWRLAPFISVENVYVVTTSDMASHVAEQLPMIPSANVLYEPFGRNTGPAIAFALSELSATLAPDDIVVVIPADHVVQNLREYHLTLDRATTAAAAMPVISTIGIVPTRAETGYGYIQVGSTIVTENPLLQDVLKSVRTFAEKPDLATAQRLVDSGDFVWNSGVFVATLLTFAEAISTHMPDHAPLFAVLERVRNSDTYQGTLESVYRQIRSVSFDVAVMEKAHNICVVEGGFGWSDVGTWDELYRLHKKDSKNNVIEGNVVTIRSTNSFVNSASGRLIGLVDVDNIIVVETESSILICKRGEAEHVRDIVETLRRKHISPHL
jgi:mannose-1-phosphate guanylyltransferase